jgi:SAM-dependent methyltransferase
LNGPSKCAVCGAAQLEQLVNFGEVPQSGVFLASADASVPKRGLSFYYCRACGFVGQRESQATTPDYTAVVRATKRQLPDYAGAAAKELQSEPGWQQALVIEVGANDGTFLDLLAANGHQSRLAIEPSRALSEICASQGHRVEPCHLTSASSPGVRARYGAARTVVCRHTLEHVPDPLDLLEAMRLLLNEGGLLFVEVPSVAPIVERLWSFELWDEHLSYFSIDTLARLLHTAGFAVERLETRAHRGSTNILGWARVSANAGPVPEPSGVSSSVELCQRFAKRWQAYCEDAWARLGGTRREVYAVGASHPQSNYLNFSGLGARITALVDDDPVKIGRYVPLPQPTRVLSTASFCERADDAVVLLTAFGYRGWMSEVRRRLASKRIEFIDPIEDLARH